MNNWQPLLDILKQNNWQQQLESEPRFIKIKQCPFKTDTGDLIYPELYMLSYGEESDFNDPVVRCCRGSIVSFEDETNPVVVCQTFLKFGNYGQDFCPEIDWSSAKVQDKRDGCLIKLFNYKDNWIWVSNNGWNINLDVTENVAKLPSKFSEPETDNCKTFMDLINYSMNQTDFDHTKLEKTYTYMFELCSPKIRILVDNPKTELVYLGSRNNVTTFELTLEEACLVNPELKKLKTVEYFDLHTIADTLALCDSYDDDTKEGVVICDKYFNRVKIKCKHYVKLKYIRNSTATKEDKIFDMIVSDTVDDLFSVFPELIPTINSIKQDYCDYLKYLRWHIENAKKNFFRIKQIDQIDPKKTFAVWVLNNYPNQSHIYFKAIDLYCTINYDNVKKLKENGELYKIEE